MIKDYINYIGEGFTVDDEIVAIYVRIFKEGGFNLKPQDNDEEFRDIDMWNSLSEREKEFVFESSKFTGFLNTTGDTLEIYRIVNFDFLIGEICDCIDNRIYRGGAEDSDTHITIHYSKLLPGKDGEEYLTFDVGETDLENNPAIRSGKNVKWKNRIVTQNIEWIIEDIWDNAVYLKNKQAVNSLVKYTGWEYYENGKRIK